MKVLDAALPPEELAEEVGRRILRLRGGDEDF
jgi:hypothetical protein